MVAAATTRTDALETRPPRIDDAPAVAALITAASEGWLGCPPTTAESLLDVWRTPGAQFERDARVALAGPELIGYASLQPPGQDRSTIWLDLWTRPGAGEGEIAVALLAAMQERLSARAQQAPLDAAARLRIQVDEKRHDVRAVLEQQRFVAVRSSLQMVGDIGERAQPRWPEGVSVRTYEPEDAQALYELVMEVLADTWEFHAEPFESWIAQTGVEGFDPSIWWIAEHEGEMIGVVLSRADVLDPELVWLHVLGVRRSWRGSWLQLALHLHAAHEYKARGFTRVAAGVDAENPTGARHITERARLHVAHEFVIYERELRGPRPVRRVLRRARRAVSGRSRS